MCYVVFFLFGDSKASGFYVLIFRNTLSVPSSQEEYAYTIYDDILFFNTFKVPGTKMSFTFPYNQ